MLGFLSLLLVLLPLQPARADQTIAPQNFGPPYFYNSDPSKRLYKLPWPAGLSYRTWDGYGSEPGGSHHPDYSVDFGLGHLDTLCAARGGIVSATSNTNKACNIPGAVGNFVVITNRDSMPDPAMPNGWRKVYVKDYYYHIHDVIPVTTGQKVVQGQHIAFTSCTGYDAGADHLHYKTFIDSIAGTWRHVGWFDFDTTHHFASIPTPFVEITNHPNGLPEEGDTYVSQNTRPVSVESPETPPAAPMVLSAWPNPFRARIGIKVLTAVPLPFAIGIYNANGGRVALLSSGKPENRNLEWDASAQPAGLYLLRLETTDAVHTLRVLRLK